MWDIELKPAGIKPACGHTEHKLRNILAAHAATVAGIYRKTKHWQFGPLQRTEQEIADRYGIRLAAFPGWRHQHPTFPAPTLIEFQGREFLIWNICNLVAWERGFPRRPVIDTKISAVVFLTFREPMRLAA